MKGKTFITTGVNNVGSLVPSLRRVGLSLNESKADLCRLEKSGIAACEMSRNAGILPLKVYDSSSKLTYCKLFVISSIMRPTKLEALVCLPQKRPYKERREVNGDREKGFICEMSAADGFKD